VAIGDVLNAQLSDGRLVLEMKAKEKISR